MNLSKLFSLGAEEIEQPKQTEGPQLPFRPGIMALRIIHGGNLGEAERLGLYKTREEAEAACAKRVDDPVATLYLFIEVEQRFVTGAAWHEKEGWL